MLVLLFFAFYECDVYWQCSYDALLRRSIDIWLTSTRDDCRFLWTGCTPLNSAFFFAGKKELTQLDLGGCSPRIAACSIDCASNINFRVPSGNYITFLKSYAIHIMSDSYSYFQLPYKIKTNPRGVIHYDILKEKVLWIWGSAFHPQNFGILKEKCKTFHAHEANFTTIKKVVMTRVVFFSESSVPRPCRPSLHLFPLTEKRIQGTW